MTAYEKSIFYIALSLMAASCSAPFLEDQIHNKYFEYEKVSNPNADYVGEWTSANAGGIYTVKIYPDGAVNACMKSLPKSNPGKVIKLETGEAIIYETGTIERISSVGGNQMVTTIYSQEAKYHRDDTPAECRPIFDSFHP